MLSGGRLADAAGWGVSLSWPFVSLREVRRWGRGSLAHGLDSQGRQILGFTPGVGLSQCQPRQKWWEIRGEPGRR